MPPHPRWRLSLGIDVADRGRFIVFEGIDGSGKSTQVARTAERLNAVATFEPGATEVGQRLRAILLDAATPLDPNAEALLMAADRAQHVGTVVTPTISAGRHVVSDRYVGSTLAYQGYGRGLDLDELRQVCDLATGGLKPDLVVLMDLDPTAAASRGTQDERDRFEAGRDFQHRVRRGFLELAERDERWVVVDAAAPLAEVNAVVDAAVDGLLGGGS